MLNFEVRLITLYSRVSLWRSSRRTLIHYCSLTLLVFLVSLSLSAQIDRTSHWLYKYANAYNYGYTEVAYEKDTVVDDLTLSKFTKYNFRVSILNDTLQVNFAPLLLTERDSVVLFQNNQGVLDTLFNFKLGAGEEYHVNFLDRSGEPDSLRMYVREWEVGVLNGYRNVYQVIDVGRYLSNGRLSIFPDTFQYNIGSVNYYIVPYDFILGGIDGSEAESLKTFRSDYVDCRRYNREITDSLDYSFICPEDPVSLTTTRTERAIRVLPNPTSGRIRLQLTRPLTREEQQQCKIVISNATGQIVTQSGWRETFDLSRQPPGVYYLSLTGAGRTPSSHKLVLRSEW